MGKKHRNIYDIERKIPENKKQWQKQWPKNAKINKSTPQFDEQCLTFKVNEPLLPTH